MRTLFPERRAFALAAVLAFLFAGAALVGQGNPFTSSEGSPRAAAVRSGRAGEGLVRAQTALRNAIAEYFRAWKDSRSPRVLWSVLAVAFAYGLLHAAGPGHRKTVVFSLYLAKKAKALEPLGVGLLLSALHAGSSVVLMAVLKRTAGAISGRSADLSALIEGVSYTILVLMSLVLLVHAIIGLARRKTETRGAMGTGALLLSGLYPCPGVVLILALSLGLGMMGLGVAAVGAMSLGMSIPIIASGYLAWLGRTGLFARLKRNEGRIALVSCIVETAGYALLFSFSLFIAWPFIVSLLRRS